MQVDRDLSVQSQLVVDLASAACVNGLADRVAAGPGIGDRSVDRPG